MRASASNGSAVVPCALPSWRITRGMVRKCSAMRFRKPPKLFW
jgi:hypothetical protein